MASGTSAETASADSGDKLPAWSSCPTSAELPPVTYQATGREQRVEVFYASAPGRAAAELDTVDCEGLFTRVLHDGLTGMLHNGLGAEASIR